MDLDERLSAIAAMIPSCESCADIGTDHGFLGAYLLEKGICDTVLFLDISETSLRKAWRLCRGMNLLERAEFYVGDGALALPSRVDAAVIAGMGGETIAGIVERGREKLGGARLVMQPNVGTMQLRDRLMRAGYRIVDERIVRAAGRWYVVLAAEPGEAVYADRELLIGPMLLKRSDAELVGYAQFRLRVAKKALAGAEVAGASSEGYLRWEAEQWEAVIDEREGS